MVTEMDKINVRRHLDIAFAGILGYSDTIGLSAVTRAGQLELYLNALQPGEESVLLGSPFALCLLYAPFTLNQILGFTFTTNLSATIPTVWPTIYYTVTAQDVAASSPANSVAANAALAIMNAGIGIVAASGRVATSTANLGGYAGFAELYMTAANRQPFLLAVSGPQQLASDGSQLPYPQLVQQTSGTQTTTIAGVLPIANYLESSMYGVDARLAFWQAGASSTGEVNFNRMELRQRQALYRYTCRQMAVLLGFSLGTHQGVGRQAYGIPGT